MKERINKSLALGLQLSCSTPEGTWAEVERTCCKCLCDMNSIYQFGIIFDVFETLFSGLCGCTWHVSAKSRNKRMHSLVGNGPSRAAKGKGKSKQKAAEQNQTADVSQGFAASNPSSSGGKGKGNSEAFLEGIQSALNTMGSTDKLEERLEAERLFKEQMLGALPSHLASSSPQLVQEEWNTTVTSAQALSAHGGVALVMKKDIPAVVSRIGQTTRATAIVTSQPAAELYMPAAHCREVLCSIIVQSDSGPTRVTVKRYLIQLGMNPDNFVTMDTESLDTIQESITMVKVVVRFDSRGVGTHRC